jgi:altronate dehydratase small subunit
MNDPADRKENSSQASPLPLRLHDADNVLIAVRKLMRGDVVSGITIQSDIDTGHKLAARDIAAGEKILKWGCPIGSATRAIVAGEHVHTHNLKSDYLPTFTLDSGKRFVEGRQ